MAQGSENKQIQQNIAKHLEIIKTKSTKNPRKKKTNKRKIFTKTSRYIFTICRRQNGRIREFCIPNRYAGSPMCQMA